MRDPDFTLSAGPVAASPRVLAALGSPLLYHYDPAFQARYRGTEQNLRQVFRTRNDILLMQGEAILGLEAAARALVRPGAQVLNLVQGIFGKGMGYWLNDFGAELHELEVPYNEAVDPVAVEAYLDAHPDIELVTIVHSETPSGTYCDIAAIGPIAREHGALTLVDCVSSLGGMRLETDDWQLDVCVAGAQKCLGGPPGMTLMSVSEAAWERAAANPAAPRASYLSMLDWKEQWLEGDKFPFTPSVSDLHGVEAAVDELLEEGLETSIERHARAAAACRAGARALGLDLWPRADEIAADCVTAIAVPEGLTDAQVRAHCRERYGVMISAGQGAGNLVRIGHMATSASGLYPVIGLAALGQTLLDLGARVDVGAAVETALAEIAQASPAPA
jgi:pyridoxamine--pyruvate transaminase